MATSASPESATSSNLPDGPPVLVSPNSVVASQAQSPSPFPLTTPMRTHTCGELRLSNEGQTVQLSGWAHAVRDTGGVIFILLRDRHGIVQVTVSDICDPAVMDAAKSVRLEYVLTVEGTVSVRDEAVINRAMPTGEVEVLLTSLRIVSRTKPIPFMIAEQGKDAKAKDTSKKKRKPSEANGSLTDNSSVPSTANEDTRLKYRFLDLRRPALQNNLVIRHRTMMAIRKYLDASGFLEVETPILTKATPEGARDYLVPSRVHPGCWYALPQSPQIYKQLLMVSGFDRYFQITRCFRDEDLRVDRQPEFTQVDLEMSFVDHDSVMSVAEGIISSIFSAVLNISIGEIPRISYTEAMDRFGVDAPDLRFGLELKNITSSDVIQRSEFSPIASARDKNAAVKGMVIPGGAKSTSRKTIDGYTAFVKEYGLSGLLYGKVEGDGTVTGPLSKLASAEEIKPFLSSTLMAKGGDLVLIAFGKASAVNAGLGRLRVKIGHENGLIAGGPEYAFCWVVDFPLLEYDMDTARYTSVHHPFTSPLPSQVDLLDDDSRLGELKSDAYDLVCNGSEIGGGSIRIHDAKIQQKVFRALGISEAEQNEKFGFLLDALSYGAPPHGGIAFGLDRCVMIMSKSDSIRDVVAFPKTSSASDLMAGAPAPVAEATLSELRVTSAKADEIR